MKRFVNFFTCFIFVILFLGMSVGNAFARSAGPPDGETGSPADSGNTCTVCHTDFAVNSGTLTFSITTPANYTPGTAQNVTVSFDNASGGMFGFELMVLDASTPPVSVGTLTIGGGDTQLGTSPSYIKQTASGNTHGASASWSFTWTPLAGQTGTVTFYAAGNEADGTGGTDNDRIYTATAMASPVGAVTDPVLDIDINGLDGPVTLGTSAAFNLTISMNGGGNTDPVDWWVYVTAGGSNVYWTGSTWVTAVTPLTSAYPPLTFGAYPVLSLPGGIGSPFVGTYHFSVDDNNDGLKDDTFTDSVDLTVRDLSFSQDILPLFSASAGTGAWFPYGDPDVANGSPATACGTCHAGGEPPEECPPECHFIDFNSHAGWLAGADEGMMPLLGESSVGATDYNWGKSKLRSRLRDNRMPPGFPFNIGEENRDGGDVDLSDDGNDIDLGGGRFWVNRAGTTGLTEVEYGGANNAVGLLGAYVASLGGDVEGYADSDGAVVFADIAGLFSLNSAWYNGSVSCTACHFCDTEPPCFHMIDFDTEAGLLAGADEGTMPLLGESSVGDTDYSWSSKSKLKNRLRDNRMPPDAPFDVHELTRDGRTFPHPLTGVRITAVDLIGEWVIGPDGVAGTSDDALDN